MEFGVSAATFRTRFGPIVFTGNDLVADFKRIKDLGYDGVDLFIHRLSEAESRRVNQAATELQLKIPLVAALFLVEQGVNLADPERGRRRTAVREFEAQIRSAKWIGAVGLSIGLIRGNKAAGESDSAYQQRLAESLTELLEIAALNGVKLYLEPLNRYEINTFNRVDQALEFMAKYGLSSLELLLDTFHMNIEERRLEQAISLAGARIGHIHITDSNRLAPGQGHLDYDRIIAAVKNSGYNKFLSIEALPLPSSVACARQGIEFLKAKTTILT